MRWVADDRQEKHVLESNLPAWRQPRSIDSGIDIRQFIIDKLLFHGKSSQCRQFHRGIDPFAVFLDEIFEALHGFRFGNVEFYRSFTDV